MNIERFKYIRPSWYFNLKPAIDHCYFPTYKTLRDNGYKFELDERYDSKEAKELDCGYQAFQRGVILTKNSESNNIWKNINLSTNDEYRFIRKNISSFWVFYVLLLRILSFHNPIKELRGYFKSKKINKELYHQKIINYSEYESFESKLIKSDPLVSVIIPTLGRYKYLKDVFRDLEKQNYSNFEVIVVDQTEPFDESVYQGWKLDLKYWYQDEKALWKARNDAISQSKGDYILLYDDDSLIEPDWIAEHLKALDFFNADLSSGVSLSTVGAKIPVHYSYFRWSEQLDTGNVLIKRKVFEKIGLFDRQFEKQRMGDGEYGLRAYLAGFRNISNPKAKRIHLKVGSGGLREMGSWDAFRPKKFFAPRPIPSVLYLFRKYHGNKAAFLSIIKDVPRGITPYKFKGNNRVLAIGILISVILLPIVVVQVLRSWKISSSMLKEGAKVTTLPKK